MAEVFDYLIDSICAEVTENLGISRATSRNRLGRIMAKTDTQRQRELLQLILRSSVPAR
jgi:DNA-binding CsgD family transcriptional regulator